MVCAHLGGDEDGLAGHRRAGDVVGVLHDLHGPQHGLGDGSEHGLGDHGTQT